MNMIKESKKDCINHFDDKWINDLSKISQNNTENDHIID
jgi:hypothetical protein